MVSKAALEAAFDNQLDTLLKLFDQGSVQTGSGSGSLPQWQLVAAVEFLIENGNMMRALLMGAVSLNLQRWSTHWRLQWILFLCCAKCWPSGLVFPSVGQCQATKDTCDDLNQHGSGRVKGPVGLEPEPLCWSVAYGFSDIPPNSKRCCLAPKHREPWAQLVTHSLLFRWCRSGARVRWWAWHQPVERSMRRGCQGVAPWAVLCAWILSTDLSTMVYSWTSRMIIYLFIFTLYFEGKNIFFVGFTGFSVDILRWGEHGICWRFIVIRTMGVPRSLLIN